MDKKRYNFDEEHLIVAYNGETFAGFVLTHPYESFTKTELLNFFRDTDPTYLIAARLPDTEDFTPHNYYSMLNNLIEELCVNDQTNLDIEYYIPRTIH